MRSATVVVAATLSMLVAVTPAAGACHNVDINQQRYLSLTPLVYAYVPDINKQAGGWKPFTVRVLVGQYRSPMLLREGVMVPSDLNKLLRQRTDIVPYDISIPAYFPRSSQGRAPDLGKQVFFNSGRTSMTVRVVQVIPAPYFSFGSDRVRLEVCP